MEDAHFAAPDLGGNGWTGSAAFGVLDGHGGADVAKYCAGILPQVIAAQPSNDPHTALIASFLKVDELMKDERHLDYIGQGCTAVVCVINKDYMVVANAGDSRAVLSRGGRAIALSEDHKPHLRREQDRIHRAGGMVTESAADAGGPRVMGDLNLSRSLGDFRHKQDTTLTAAEQIITSKPDVATYYRQPNDEFLILACDGVWDVLSNDDAVSFVSQRLSHGAQTAVGLSQIVEEMLDACLSPDLRTTRGLGGDNMTAVLVTFNNKDIQWGVRHLVGALGCV